MNQSSSAVVDIIIPAYNASRFLPKALDSVLEQTFQQWRVILIDDGSTDSTSDVVASYASRLGSRMLFLQQQNRGLPAARNTAIRNGTAPLIALLDADDVWLPHRLERSVASLVDNASADLSYGFVSRVDEFDKLVSTHDQLLPNRDGAIAASIYTRRLHLPCPTITFRRPSFERSGGFDEAMRATEDRDLWLRIAFKAQVICVPEVIALYRISPGAMTTDVERMFEAQLRFIEKHKGTECLTAQDYHHALSSIYRQRAETESQHGQFKPAFRHVTKAIQLRPRVGENWVTAASILKRGWKKRD